MRDEHDGQALRSRHALDLVVQVVAGHGVERAERLVHEDDPRVLGQAAGQRDALAHAAGELVRTLVAPAVEPHGLEQLRPRGRGARAWARRASLSASSTFCRAVSQGSRVASWNMKATLPSTSIVPEVGLVEPGDEVEQRALAAAGRPDDGDELAGRHVEAHVAAARRSRPAPDRTPC